MGRIQSSVGLITGTDIAGTVDQLIAISGQPRDRLVARTEVLQRQQGSIAELTALVIGVQLAGNKLTNASVFRGKKAESSNAAAVSATAGNNAEPGKVVVRTLQTASTHTVRSLQRFSATDEPLGLSGKFSIDSLGGYLDESVKLSELNQGRGVEAGSVRITDRAGVSADIDLSEARTIDDVLDLINDANVGVRATTTGNAITLSDTSGGIESNLIVAQLGDAETAADLGLWGINTADSSATGNSLELPTGTAALRGVPLAELNGGSGLGTLTNLEITLSDGSTAAIDLSTATSTADVVTAIQNSGLSLIARLNDARNGLQIRDVSGGSGTVTISSADNTAAALGLQASTSDDIIVGRDLNRQRVTSETKLANLNGGAGVGKGTFTITDSAGAVGVINLANADINTVGDLLEAINGLNISVSAALNEAGDGIAVTDTAAGDQVLQIKDSGSGTSARQLGIAGAATAQTIAGETVSALVGSQADVITVDDTDTLASIVEKINQQSDVAKAAIELNEDGTYALSIRGKRAGQAGQIAINTSGFDLDLRTAAIGRDARIAVATDGGSERFLTSSDGVFDLAASGTSRAAVSVETNLNEIGGPTSGSFTITDSQGKTGAINIVVDGLKTVGQLIDKINSLGLAVTASINEAGNGIQVVDDGSGGDKLTITDIGSGTAAASLKIAGEATTQQIDGQQKSAIVGKSNVSTSSGSGLVLTLKELADSPITINVTKNTSAVISSAKSLVDQYNLLAAKLDSLTSFNADTNEIGLLFGSNEALRVRSGFSRLLSGRITAAGSLTSIAQVGLRLNDAGNMELDSSKLTEALEKNPADVENFFTTDSTGLAKRISDIADRLAGDSNSLLIGRTLTLTTEVEANRQRVDSMNLKLERERERLLKQFFAMEQAIGKLQNNQSAIDSIKPITIPT
jgi:flagellar hook-associated protein 2